ncbi:MAG: hypothetical protein A2X25_12750 [Chloroflexi bacterium GWB2_49_20]|nr:MAG: hypothetical protein A2X25_12750 [Chloroflexi bacterium GWB2_49_20]OGN78413.1 MAG: hypothetical protein A2X26_01450 [Chloroflexi bacterium GWC2_49_37]OGN84124.1 MAG: hypothetical protein A2X27_14235 [Chloroflexi bacterium GWD2_49_16]HBG75227.1 hypothetical protein [Anaerolineae bacterium]HCC79138.1 hypothetical protein [Anaerolineae bacterium]
MIKSGIGINQSPGVKVQQMVEICQEAEHFGYDSCWAADQGLDTRDIFVTLAAIAQKTTTLRLGTGITHPFTRHPAVTASAIASLDELSGGRAFLGVSAGGIDTFIPLGVDRPKPVAATREMIQISRALFKNEAVNFDGELFHLKGARIDSGRSDIEIWMAARGPKMIALGGEMADGILVDFIHKDFLQDFIDQIQVGAKISGKKPKICYSTMIVTNERALEEVRPLMFYRLLEPPQNVREAIHLTQEDTESLRREAARGGLLAAGKLIKDEWVEPFVFMGSIEKCATELTQFIKKYKIDEFMLPIMGVESAPEIMSDVAKVMTLVNNGS